MVIHEDTQFLPGSVNSQQVACGIVDGGMGMDDDTDILGGPFLPSAAAGGGSQGGGLAIYEDTQFLPGIGGGHLPSSSPSDGRALPGIGLMHEDTEFITRDIVWNRPA